MNQSSVKISGFRASLPGLILLAVFVALAIPDGAEARPGKCFGKKINRVVNGDGKTVHLKYRDVAWIAGDRVTVIAKPYSRICADQGRQYVRPGKGRTWTSTGSGDDRIHLHPKSNKNKVQAGLGNDLIVGSRGHDFLYGSPKGTPQGARDRDVIKGGGGNDRIYDYGGTGNRLYGLNGSDRIHSLGNAVSELHGGNGTDFLFSNGGITEAGTREKLFGEQGNDRLKADRPGKKGPAYLDGGEGDDWVFGTPKNDTIITHSGIKKLYGKGGDDLFVTAGRGRARISGGPGADTISYAAHTPPGGRRISGVIIDLRAGTSLGTTRFQLDSLEHVIGSAFDDEITADPGVNNQIDGGLGDDVIVGNQGDNDSVDGGLGVNQCSGFAKPVRCNDDSPGNFGNRLTLVDISEGGIPIVMGGNRDDRISIGYDASNQRFRVNLAEAGVPSGDCRPGDGSQGSSLATTIDCPVDRNNLDGLLAYGGDGDDNIKLENSIPATMTTTLNGGTGRNEITGGRSKDFISTAWGSAGSVLSGGPNLDLLYANDRVTLNGGPGTDNLRATNPCLGATFNGGPGTDGAVFAGAPRGVKVNIAGGYAEWLNGNCPARMRIARNVEKIEGTEHNDWLILGRRFSTQQGRSSLLGREGIDVLNAKNGRVDSVTTGEGGRRNKVIADRKDKVRWGWGLAGY